MTRTKSGWALLGLAAIVITLGACGGSGAGSGAPEEVAQGMDLFRGTCAACHGQDAKGITGLGQNLHKNQYVGSHTDEELLQYVIEGRPANHPDNTIGVAMPPRAGNPNLTDDDIRLILKYIRTLQ
jgi:mono/diheme cytochrome c family protein